MRRWGVFAAGVAASLALTALLWAWGVPGFFLFLLLPPLLLLRRPQRRCPSCGLASSSPDVRYCPRDGTPMQ